MATTLPKKFIMAMIFYGLVVGGAGWIFWWMAAAVRNFDDSLREIESAIASLEEERKVARRTEVLLEKRADDLQLIEGFLVNKERPIEFIENLEKMAKDTANLMALDFDESRSRGLAELFLRLTVDGTEKSTRQYLRLLELVPYQIRVEEILFQKLQGQEPLASEQSRSRIKEFQPTHRLVLLMSVKSYSP